MLPRKPYLTREQARQIDRIAIEEYGIPGIVLMENAARGVASQIVAKNTRVAIVCGGGNNGGDGYAVARLLHNAGAKVELFAVSHPRSLRGDAAINFNIVERMNLPVFILDGEAALKAAAQRWRKANVLVDAILGTGFSGALRPELAPVIDRLNGRGRNQFLLSVDLPSGLDCDTGLPSNPAVKANVTVTFVAEKIGFKTAAAKKHLGVAVRVAQIGTPPEILKRVLAQRS